jgi:hypothetical protein
VADLDQQDVVPWRAAQREQLAIIDIDPDAARDKHLTRYNDVIADRKPEFYGDLIRVRDN